MSDPLPASETAPMRPPPFAGLVLCVGTDARCVRHAVGPVAWCVLEDVVADGGSLATEPLTARTNVRRIAHHLGVSKDAAARAVKRLVEAGVLVRRGGQRRPDGTFGPAVYEVRLGELHGVAVVEVPTTRPSQARSTRRHAGIPQGQPSFFDADGALP